MSLVQHLTVEDVFECDIAADDDSVDDADNHQPRASWRRMSFDAFAPVRPHFDLAEDKQHREAAYKASTLRRILQVSLAVTFCFLASGIVFGFASIKPILVAEGVYSEFCTNTAGRRHRGQHPPCAEQEMRLNLLFVVASVTTNTSSLFAGYTLDRFGRRWCATAAAGFLAMGALLMASHGVVPPQLDGYLLGHVFLSLGGTFLFLPSFQLSNAFPQHAGLVVALITCAFDASSAVFYLYRLVWDATGLRLSPFFLGYLGVPAAIVLAEWTVMPKQRYHTLPELEWKITTVQEEDDVDDSSDEEISDTHSLLRVRSDRAEQRRDKLDRIEELAGDAAARRDRLRQQDAARQQPSDAVWGLLHGRPVRAQMATPFFALLLCVTAFQMLRMNFFIATIGSQYRYMLGADGEARVAGFFNAALPVGGVAATPLIALLLNRCSVATVLAVMTAYVALMGVLNCFASVAAGMATVVVFVTFRPFYYSAVSYTASKIFGFATFGRVYGTVICVSGVLNLVQPALESWLSVQLQGNPLVLNIALGIVGTVLAAMFTAYVKWQSVPKRRNVVDSNGHSNRGALWAIRAAEYPGTPGCAMSNSSSHSDEYRPAMRCPELGLVPQVRMWVQRNMRTPEISRQPSFIELHSHSGAMVRQGGWEGTRAPEGGAARNKEEV
ncbi:MFS transporter, putative [Cordyceps militaris CM01]|uniref:MFS transporter, putative n=1 Tax=Cordyceps militaris (strain CM01) TaxID=983644 RepID=G3JMQ0_CORMM|nr:MFS transporter, putative [Cordyceps militaris CM01]EGX90086.1 MFS transporter, putative [Cordyceps militaris CM01]